MFNLSNLGFYTISAIYKRQIKCLCWNYCIGFSSRSAQKNHYETLSLPRNCTSKEIRAAFITLSKQYHPDKNKGNTSAQEEFVKVNEAYSVLSKAHSRRNYDFTLLQSENPSSTKTEWREVSPDPRSYYHVNRPWQDPWKDPSFARNRKVDEDHYYGVRGYTRQSNQTVLKTIMICFGIIIVIQILSVRFFGLSHVRYLDKKSAENSKTLEEVRRRADSYVTHGEAVDALSRRLEAVNER